MLTIKLTKENSAKIIEDLEKSLCDNLRIYHIYSDKEEFSVSHNIGTLKGIAVDMEYGDIRLTLSDGSTTEIHMGNTLLADGDRQIISIRKDEISESKTVIYLKKNK